MYKYVTALPSDNRQALVQARATFLLSNKLGSIGLLQIVLCYKLVKGLGILFNQDRPGKPFDIRDKSHEKVSDTKLCSGLHPILLLTFSK